ncbi:MAG: FAD-dependent oxidoreductase [Proteobacteria bacterium]|nr:FAD-dependent oxidoreductase [Pseudomonadota bacterium]
MEGKKVLVIGGSLSGIQSALDMAEDGKIVYLVESAPGLSGEKLFPVDFFKQTTPFVSSKWEQAKKHPNIHIISNGVIDDARKENGSFKIKIKKAALRVLEDKCNDCKECIKVCPVNLRDDYSNGLGLRTAVDYFNQETKTYGIIKERPVCEESCPVHLDIRGYIGLIADGKYKEALNLIREKLPFPATIGRICPHPCEEKCNRARKDSALCIRDLKRFVADSEIEAGYDEVLKKIKPNGRKVAIIGAGPSGLACAHDLSVLGYDVVIFEELPVAGGMLAVGIPKYRLPRDILNKEIDIVKKLGAQIRTDARIGKDLSVDDLFKQGFEAVFVAVGAHKGQKLRIPGEDATGVVPGVNYLRELNLGKEVQLGKKVAVIGGGNVAMDSARSSFRLGAEEVSILYRRTREEMPASGEEIDAALSEGIKFEYLVAPLEVLIDNGKVKGLRCNRMQLGEPDASGRRRPVAIEGSEFEIELDMIIPAIGQTSDLSFLPEDNAVETTKWGTIVADSGQCCTKRQGIFAGGDCVTGPNIAIEAVAAGKKAALSIDDYLKGK